MKLRSMLFFKILLLVLWGFCFDAYAQNPPEGTARKPLTRPSTAKPPGKVRPPSVLKPTHAATAPQTSAGTKFGLVWSPRYTMQAEKQPNGTRAEYIVHEINPSVTSENYKLNAFFTYLDFVKTPTNNDWDNTVFEGLLNNPWDASDWFTLKPSVYFVAPLLKKGAVSDIKYMYGARLTAALKGKELDVPNFIFKYGLQAMQLVQKNDAVLNPDGTYVLDVDGNKQFNIAARLRQRVHVGYMLTDSLLAMIYFHLDSNFLFDNDVRNSFLHETFLEYSFSPNFLVNVGISNGGGVYSGEFQEQDNLKFYNETSAEVFIGAGIGF